MENPFEKLKSIGVSKTAEKFWKGVNLSLVLCALGFALITLKPVFEEGKKEEKVTILKE